MNPISLDHWGLREKRILAKLLDIVAVLFVSILLYPLGIILSIIYLSFAEYYLKGVSLGKKIFSLTIVSLNDGGELKWEQSLLRNLPFTIPLTIALVPIIGWFIGAISGFILIIFELYLVYTLEESRRVGDVVANTSVVDSTQSELQPRNVHDSWFE